MITPKQASDMFKRMFSERWFLAEVVSVDSNQISVKRLGYQVTEGPFAAADGLAAAVSGGDRVLVTLVGGHYIVICKVVT